MNILILGASGLIGGNLLDILESNVKHKTLGSYFSFPTERCKYFNTLDLSDPKNEIDINTFAPEAIVHCGALTWVDYCEDHAEESYDKTVRSTINAIEIAKMHKSKLVYLSTDYVFDGKSGPYTEEEKTSPVSVYGQHKLEAEELVQASGLDYVICRVTNVYGDEIRGKNFIARLLDTLTKGEEANFDFPLDQMATPVNAKDVARAIVLLLEHEKQGIYNIASTDYMNRVQLAERVLAYFDHHKVQVNPVLTEEMNQKAERPLYGGLISTKFLKEFPTFQFSNVDDYVKQYIQ